MGNVVWWCNTMGDTNMTLAGLQYDHVLPLGDSNPHNIVRYCLLHRLLSAWKVFVLTFVMNMAVYRTFMRRW
jgi:hypothetical protein